MKRASKSHKVQIALIVGLSLMLVWASAFYELYRSRQTYLHDAEVRTSVQAQVFSEYSRSTFKRINEVILDLRTRWNGDWQAFAAQVTRAQENIDDFSFQVAVIDKDGLLAFSNLTTPTDRTDLSQREHFKVHKESANADRLFISRPVKGKVSGKWSIQVTRSILRNGRFDGVVVISVSPEKFAGFAEKLGIRGDGVLTLVRDTGEIMARHPAIEKSLGQVLKDRPYHVVGAPDSGRFRQIALVDGMERIYGYHRLPEYGITFVVGESITDVLAPYEAHFFIVIGGALAVSVLAMFLFFMLFRSLVDLEAVRQQLVAIFALSPDGFVSFDARRVVMYASPAFIRMTGLEEAEIAGLDEDTFSERLVQRCAEHARFPGVAALRERQRSSAAGPVKQNRQLIEMAESSKRVLEVGIRLSESSQVSQILYFRDVTHETEIDRMKSEFLSHAAHELRTPMASIYGFSELLLEVELDEATRRDLLETIHRQTQQLVEIINELLDLARIEERRGKDFKVEAVNLATLVRETVTDLGFDAALWPVKLDLPDEKILARADAAKLRQALINVLGNAQKYSPDGGELSVGLTSVRPGFVGIKVEDRGIGMSLEQLSHFGQRFWRADTSGKTPGTGLGLAIVKEIISLHGGEVEVSSVQNRGTTITLWLPASGTVSA